MPRITRAQAAQVAQNMHIDEDVFLELPGGTRLTPKPDDGDRTPLAEIEPNSAKSDTTDESQNENKDEPTKRTRKGGRKGRKAHENTTNTVKQANVLAAEAEPPVEVLPDNHERAPSPASKAASEDLMNAVPHLEMSHQPVENIRAKSPPSSAVRLTRSQLRKQPSRSVVKGISQEIADQETMPNTLQYMAREASPVRLSTPTKQDQSVSVLELSSYDELEAAAVEAQASPPRSAKSLRTFQAQDEPAQDEPAEDEPVRDEIIRDEPDQADPITALDALDEAVDHVNAEVPDIQPSPQKVRSKKASPVVRTTKASQARISLAHGPKDGARVPSLGRPRPSTALGRSAGDRVTSTSSNKSNEDAPQEKKEVVIPHSKPRPISMLFPTPPPPPKSTKAPTRSNFQLPGEAIAAKLKASKEARLQKEAEDQQKKTFKARPAPAMKKAPTVRQTSASKARESLMTGKPIEGAPSHQRPSSVIAPRPSLGPKPNASKATNRMSIAPKATVSVSKRPSTAMANFNKPRPATFSRPGTSMSRPSKSAAPRPATAMSSKTSASSSRPASTVPGQRTAGTVKGKEVFNRAAQAKSAAEKEKREKEEAAKKARAEAAERGRQASREWAEKQRLRKLGQEGKAKESQSEPEQKGETIAGAQSIEAS